MMLTLPLSSRSTISRCRRLRNPVRSVPQFREPGREAASPLDIIPRKPNLEPEVERPILNQAEADLERYCSKLQDEAEKERCLRVHKYLTEQHEQYVDGCKRELDTEGQPGKSCQSLARLEKMVREVEGTKKELIKTIGVMERLNSRDSKGPGDALLSQDARDTMDIANHYEELKNKAKFLFNKVDKNSDGRMDVAEFRDAMKLLSTELAGDEVMTIFTCLDAHGYITEEQFVDVVLAEKDRLENPRSDAALLRTLHVESNWWSEMPHSVDSL